MERPRQPGSWLRTVSAIRKLVQRGITTRIAAVATSVNMMTVAGVSNWAREEFGISMPKPYDVVRTCGRGATTENIPWEMFVDQHVRTAPEFIPASRHLLEKTLYGNVCWSTSACIMPNGDVTPCEMEIQTIQGNITDRSLTEILTASASAAQDLSKDNIEICRDCEYRYVCWECRAMANQLGTGPKMKPATCMYDPYSGKWSPKPNDFSTLLSGST